MQSRTPVEIADKNSRRRAIIVAAGTIVFVVGQLLSRTEFRSQADTGLYLSRSIMWSVNVILLLAFLATGGGILNNREIRALVNDEVSRLNYKTSVVAGFWVAMTMALAIYLIPGLDHFTGRQAVYVVVTSSVAVASIVFSYLELRAHRDA
jgi:hypothetical protein